MDYKEAVHQLFLSFKKACDSIRREFFYNILIEYGIIMTIARLIEMCLNETYSRDRIGKHLSGILKLVPCIFIILYNNQPMCNQFTNYYTAPTISTLSSHPHTACSQHLAKLRQYVNTVFGNTIYSFTCVVEISMIKIFKMLKLSYL
jgi:hypothetical protein